MFYVVLPLVYREFVIDELPAVLWLFLLWDWHDRKNLNFHQRPPLKHCSVHPNQNHFSGYQIGIPKSNQFFLLENATVIFYGPKKLKKNAFLLKKQI